MKNTSEFLRSLEETLKQVNSKHTPVPVREVILKITVSEAVKSFCDAFVREGYRKNPLCAEKINLTVDELMEYVQYLIHKRIEVVKGTCRDYRRIKRLAMPCFIERMLTDIGRVRILDKGLDIRPECDDQPAIDLTKAIEISDKIESFSDDLSVVTGAMPREEMGNPETMSMALIQDYVLGMGDYDDPLLQYIVTFLQLQLEDEMFNNLYCMRYDDVKTIMSNITALGRSLVV